MTGNRQALARPRGTPPPRPTSVGYVDTRRQTLSERVTLVHLVKVRP